MKEKVNDLVRVARGIARKMELIFRTNPSFYFGT